MDDFFKQRYLTASENLQLLYTLYVQWYTFFWTLNGASLAWLYGSDKSIAWTLPWGKYVLPAVFLTLNILAFATDCFCLQLARKLRRDACEAMLVLAKDISSPIPSDSGLFTDKFAAFVFKTGMASFVANIAAWIILPFVR